MQSAIEIKDLRIFAYHGVYPEERILGNRYLIDVMLKADISQAVTSDNLEDTINYAEVVSIVQNEMQETSLLLEHVAGRILKKILLRWSQVSEASLKIAKQSPPIAATVGYCAIRLQMTRDDL